MIFLIGIVGLSLFLCIKGVVMFTSGGKRHSIGLGRLAYGILGIVAVPVIFTVVLTIANMCFTIFNPNAAAAFITSSQITSIKNQIDTQLGSISQIIEPVQWQDSTDLANSLDEMLTQLNKISADAYQAGNQDLATACNSVISELNTLRPMVDVKFVHAV